MKIEKTKLQKALETVKPGLANKEMIEQTTSFCFLDGRVVTYNDEISISCPVDDLELEGAINATELYSFISKAKTDDINMEIVDNEILLKSGRSKAGFTLQSEIVLPIKEIGSIKKWKTLPKGFLKSLRFAAAACSADMSRPVLTCVHVNDDIIEGTDGYRVTHYTLKEKMPIKEFLLPATSCGNVIRMKPTEIAEGEGWIHFKTKDDAIMSCRVFEDKYVDTSAFLKIEGEDINFPKEIIGILDRAGVFAKRDHSLDEIIYITIENKKMIIKSKSSSGWFTEKARTDYEGDVIDFSITPYLLKDILNETNKGKISDGRLMFQGEDWKYITMLRGN